MSSPVAEPRPPRVPPWLMRAARLLVLAGLAWLAWLVVAGQWEELRAQPLEVHPRWGSIALSAIVVLLTYTLLIELWRRLIGATGQGLAPFAAARVWFVSALGRYVPGRVWQVGAMAVLARRAGVSAIAATGAAVVNTLVNIAAGMVVAVATGGALLDRAFTAGTEPAASVLRPSELALLLAAAGLLGLVALPWLLPALTRAVERLTKRQVELPPLRPLTLWVLVAGHLASWVLYGAAFQLLVHGVLGAATGATLAYVAVFTASYIVGYLALLTPGGLVVREVAMIAALTSAGLASPAEAALLAVASRLWLTVLEVLPGALFLAADAVRPTSNSLPPDRAS